MAFSKYNWSQINQSIRHPQHADLETVSVLAYKGPHLIMADHIRDAHFTETLEDLRMHAKACGTNRVYIIDGYDCHQFGIVGSDNLMRLWNVDLAIDKAGS